MLKFIALSRWRRFRRKKLGDLCGQRGRRQRDEYHLRERFKYAGRGILEPLLHVARHRAGEAGDLPDEDGAGGNAGLRPRERAKSK